MADRPVSKNGKPVLIVAIDFGTTYSGAAFAYSDEVDSQHLVDVWPAKAGLIAGSDKVPTRIVYEVDGRVSSWGFEIGETEERYQEFKLLLDKTRKLHYSGISQKFKEAASLPLSQTITPTRLTIDFLKQMRKCIRNFVDTKFGVGKFDLESIQYVITVPAIWSEHAKDLTRFCAEKSGMHNAKLITEPEAAMIHVLHDMADDDLSVDDTYMICDAGGGTVDLITYKVTSIHPRIEVEEVVQGNGDRCGGVYITRQFHQYILSNHARLVPSWTEEQTAAAIDCFENRTKRKFDDADMEVIVKVPGARDHHKDGIKIKKQKVFIPAADIKAMFDTVCYAVASLIKEQRSKAAAQAAMEKKDTAVTAIILVGGFGESPYLQKYLRNEFSRGVRGIPIINSKHGWSAVVRGALSRALPIVPSQQSTPPVPSQNSFRLIPAQKSIPRVTSRQARRFYGITLSQRFNPLRDPESKRFLVESEGKYWVECIFWFLAKGKAIKESYEIIRQYEHSWNADSKDSRDTSIMLKIVTWDNEDRTIPPPRYADAPGIEKVTDLNVDLSVIPTKDLRTKRYNDTKFYECYPDLRITYHFASIQYQLYLGTKCYGDVQSSFES